MGYKTVTAILQDRHRARVFSTNDLNEAYSAVCTRSVYTSHRVNVERVLTVCNVNL